MAHRASESGNLAGSNIPKGSIILPNIWHVQSLADDIPCLRGYRHMMHDTRIYTNANVFDPDRFLADEPAMHPNIAVFGFGRRCDVF